MKPPPCGQSNWTWGTAAGHLEWLAAIHPDHAASADSPWHPQPSFEYLLGISKLSITICICGAEL